MIDAVKLTSEQVNLRYTKQYHCTMGIQLAIDLILKQKSL